MNPPTPTVHTGNIRMRTQDRFSLWLTRLVLAFATVLFAMIGRKYVFDPAGAVRDAGIVLNTPAALTSMRASFGAFPLACGTISLLCLVAARRNRLGLWFVALLIGIVLAVRLFGIAEDGTLRENETVLTAEGVLFLATLIALIIGRAQSRTATADGSESQDGLEREPGAVQSP